jgi:hypothetical protein
VSLDLGWGGVARNSGKTMGFPVKKFEYNTTLKSPACNTETLPRLKGYYYELKQSVCLSVF